MLTHSPIKLEMIGFSRCVYKCVYMCLCLCSCCVFEKEKKKKKQLNGQTSGRNENERKRKFHALDCNMERFVRICVHK